jgi:hypothetical protein
MTGAEFLIEIIDAADESQRSPHKPSRVSIWLSPHIGIQRGANGALMPTGYDLVSGIAQDYCAYPAYWKLYSVQQLVCCRRFAFI